MQELFSALFCLKTPYNYEWWFLRGYVVFLVLGYVYLRLTEKIRNFWVELVVVLAVNFYGGNLLQFLMNAGLLPQDGPFLGLAASHWNGARRAGGHCVCQVRRAGQVEGAQRGKIYGADQACCSR